MNFKYYPNHDLDICVCAPLNPSGVVNMFLGGNIGKQRCLQSRDSFVRSLQTLLFRPPTSAASPARNPDIKVVLVVQSSNSLLSSWVRSAVCMLR